MQRNDGLNIMGQRRTNVFGQAEAKSALVSFSYWLCFDYALIMHLWSIFAFGSWELYYKPSETRSLFLLSLTPCAALFLILTALDRDFRALSSVAGERGQNDTNHINQHYYWYHHWQSPHHESNDATLWKHQLHCYDFVRQVGRWKSRRSTVLCDVVQVSVSYGVGVGVRVLCVVRMVSFVALYFTFWHIGISTLTTLFTLDIWHTTVTLRS
jgi:hypothetical protein